MNAEGSDETEKLKIENIIDYVNSVQREVSDYLEKQLLEDAISIETYYTIKRLNDEVVRNLLDKVQRKDLTYFGFISELLDHFESGEFHVLEDMEEWEIAKVMRDFIKISSHKERIIDLANKIREDFSKAHGFPLSFSPSTFCYKFDPQEIYELSLDEAEKILIPLNHHIGVAKAIEEKIRNIINYVREPDDIIRMADKTLEKRHGDCDDFTVLIASLWRALGFRVCIGLTRGHAMPAIILPSLELMEESDQQEQEKIKCRVLYTIVPGDDVKLEFAGREFSCYDLLNFNSKFREYVHAFFAREFLGFIQELADSEISEKEKKRRIKKKLEKLKETEDFKNLYEFLRRLRRIAEDFNYYPSARLSGCVHLINLDAINKIDEMVSHILMEGE